jgi:hypothetical protein
MGQVMLLREVEHQQDGLMHWLVVVELLQELVDNLQSVKNLVGFNILMKGPYSGTQFCETRTKRSVEVYRDKNLHPTDRDQLYSNTPTLSQIETDIYSRVLQSKLETSILKHPRSAIRLSGLVKYINRMKFLLSMLSKLGMCPLRGNHKPIPRVVGSAIFSDIL